MKLKPINAKQRFANLLKLPRGVVKYAEHKQSRVPDLEHIVLQEELAIYWYARYVLKQRWPEGEKVLLKGVYKWGPNTYIVREYAQNVVRERWPEAEPILKKDLAEWNQYKEFFNIKE